MKKIEDLENLNKKKILLRLDLNVPLKDEIISDTTRIDKILPTLNYLLKQKSKVIIISHIGRPKGKIDNKLSMKPVCDYLCKKLGKKVKLISQNIFELTPNSIFSNDMDNIVVLENIRFYEEEEKNNKKFAEILSKLGDLYVNDAFSCSHRDHASVTQITNFIPSYCGIQMNLEINALKKVTTEIKKPITCIIGGSKISTKIGLIKNLLKKFNNIIIVGGMANNVIEYKGFNIGKSIKEDGSRDIVKNILNEAEKFKCQIIVPIDCSVSKSFNGKASFKQADTIEKDDIILDIGPKTLEIIEEIIDLSNTVLWNGPAGYFENKEFSVGTNSIALKISQNTKQKTLISILGGGDTISAVNSSQLQLSFTHLSTAGGAFLEYLEGKDLPGLRVLK